jgi:hypothetical protein
MHTPLLGIFASAQDAECASGTEQAEDGNCGPFGGWRFALKEALHEDGTVTAVDPRKR